MRSIDAASARVGLELADVVQQRAGHGDVAVDAGEVRAIALHAPARPRASARAGRGRRPGGSAWPPARRGSGASVSVRSPRMRVEQRAQVRVLDRGDELAQVGLHLVRRCAAGRRRGRRGRTSPGSGSLSARTTICGPVARVDLVAARDAHRAPATQQLAQRLDVRPRRSRRPGRCGRRATRRRNVAAVAPRAASRRRARAGPGRDPDRLGGPARTWRETVGAGADGIGCMLHGVRVARRGADLTMERTAIVTGRDRRPRAPRSRGSCSTTAGASSCRGSPSASSSASTSTSGSSSSRPT